jgi:hypothetical protein
MTTATEVDPFAESSGAPALSFKDKPIGTTYTVQVTDSPKKVQGKDFVTGRPAVWHNKDGSTSPKYSAIINGTLDGEPVSVWATIPSDLFAKLKAAQQELGRSVRAGDTIAIRFTGEEPGKGNPKKVYAVKITPGAPPSSGPDPFGDASSATPNAAKDDQPPW